MKPEDFSKAVDIIIASNSPKVSFNVPVTDNYTYVHRILIHESNADLTNKLIAAGFKLSMCAKGLSVDKY
jgi:hypothetical protein